MVEVFKTNVTRNHEAKIIIAFIHNTFHNYKANFDLDDCDKILRVEAVTGWVQSGALIDLIRDLGYSAQVLPDEPSHSYTYSSITFENN